MNHTRYFRHSARRDVTAGTFLGLVALTLSACSSLNLKMPWSEPDPVDYAVISTNFVDALAQYPRLNPLMATVHVSRADNAFERQVHREMRSRGYKLENASAGEGDIAVDARIQLPDGGPPLYTLSVGQMSVERRFQQVNGVTEPASPMVLRGADERILTLNDEQLFPDSEAVFSTVVFQTPSEPALLPIAAPKIAAANAVGGFTEQPAEAFVRKNVFDIKQSNYSSLFEDYEELDRSVLVFPNDSLQLGDTNKEIIERFVSEMEPSTDVLSIIGCSHGHTAISNGNPLLALGRANRVKEAFLFSGVDHELVLDEGCWAPADYKNWPSRGVVLTLKRRRES